jgi:hypothetical protein
LEQSASENALARHQGGTLLSRAGQSAPPVSEKMQALQDHHYHFEKEQIRNVSRATLHNSFRLVGLIDFYFF